MTFDEQGRVLTADDLQAARTTVEPLWELPEMEVTAKRIQRMDMTGLFLILALAGLAWMLTEPQGRR